MDWSGSQLKQIAEEAGVSPRTVRRVLAGGNQEIWAGTSQRADLIRAAAERLNYRPNAAARALRRKRFDSVAFLLGTVPFQSLFSPQLLDGILEALSKVGKHLTLAKLPDERLTSPEFMPRILRELAVDGLLVNYNTAIPVAMTKLISDLCLPAVWINSKQTHDCVYPNDYEAGVAAAKLLLVQGHRHIAFANFTGYGHYSAADRRDGMADTVRAAGARFECADAKVDRGDPATALATDWLKRSGRPTALVAYTNWDCRPFITATRLMGLSIPGDLSLVTFGGDPSDWADLDVTTLQLPEATLGTVAVDQLMRRIANPLDLQPSTAVPFGLIAGTTVGRPKPRPRHNPASPKTRARSSAGQPQPRAQGSIA